MQRSERAECGAICDDPLAAEPAVQPGLAA